MPVFKVLEEGLHLDQVRQAQAKVLDIKVQLEEIGSTKRAILKDLDNLRRDLHDIYNDMKIKNTRGSGQYLELIKTEVELCTKEEELVKKLALADQEEQKLFNAFSVAITDSYEKEKIHSNMLKSLGVVGTILGSVVTLIISVVGLLYNQKKFYLLRQDVETKMLQKLDEVGRGIKEQEKNLKLQQVQARSAESWGAYLHRHTRWMYSWANPKNS